MTKTAAKRSQRRKEARPAEIIAAGMAEFAEHGLERARLDRIAKSAGVAKGTIYIYFDSKEALFEAAVQQHVVHLLDATEADLIGFEGPTRALLTRLFRRIYDRFLSPEASAILRILVAEGARFPDLVARYHAVTIHRGSALLEAIVARGIARGELRDGAVAKCPQILMAPAMFYGIHDMVFGAIDPIDLEPFFAAHVELVLSGIMIEGA